MSHIIYNGKIISNNETCISPFDRGFTLGHGFFETIMFINEACPFLKYHWSRMTTSSNLIGIPIPFDFKQLQLMIQKLIEQNDLFGKRAAIRLTITDGIFSRGILSDGTQTPSYVLTVSEITANPKEEYAASVVSIRRNENSITSRIKSISYLDNILAKKEAVEKGFDEAFLLNSRSFLAEGAISNIFIVKNGQIFTPPVTDGALPGVTRHIILNHLVDKEISIVEHSISLDFLFDADEIFISNAISGIKPVSNLDNKKLITSYPVTKAIAENFTQFILNCNSTLFATKN